MKERKSKVVVAHDHGPFVVIGPFLIEKQLNKNWKGMVQFWAHYMEVVKENDSIPSRGTLTS